MQLRGRRTHWAAIAIAGMVAGTAAAQPDDVALLRLSLEELSALEITSASKRAEPLSDAPASVFVITADDIRRSGATSLPEALRLAPALHVARAYSVGHAISARGFNGTAANKLLVLIDGRSVYTPLFSGVFWDVQDVLLQDVERIEVISGPGGTLWGVNAVNGVINVITRAAGDTRGTLASAGAGRHDAVAAVRHGYSLRDDGAMRLYAKHVRRRHTRTAAGTEVDDDAHHTQVGFRADWQRGGDRWTLQGDAYDGRREQPLPGTINIIGVDLALGDIPVSGGNLLARWERELADGADVSVQAYFDRTRRTVPPTFAQSLNIVDLQFQHGVRLGDVHRLTWGAQYRRMDDHVVNSPIVAFLPGDQVRTEVSLFAQSEFELRDDLRLTLGARLEHNDYTGAEFLPSARLAWKPAPEHLLWGALSRTVRGPSRLDRDTFVPGAPPFLLAGGPGVRSETALVAESGWRGQPAPDASMSLTLFHAAHDHLRTQQIDPTFTFIEFASGMEGDVAGIEAWGSWQAAPWWRLSAGATRLWQDLRLKAGSNDATAVALAEGANPAWQAQLRSSFDLGPRTDLDLTLRRVAALALPDVPAYTSVDLRLAWSPDDALELAVSATNLLDDRHGEFTAAATRSEFGRSVFVELTWRPR
jgi:iron complex outermembrane receptor protein